MSFGFFYGFLVIYALHSFVDFLFVVVVLFDSLLCYNNKANYHFTSQLNQSAEPSQEGPTNEDDFAKTKKNIFFEFWNNIYELYDSIFLEGQALCKTGKRYMVYWIAALGIVRVVAIATLDFQMYILVAIFYLLECLVFEYEGFTAKTMVPEKARFMSCISFALFVNTCVFLLWL